MTYSPNHNLAPLVKMWNLLSHSLSQVRKKMSKTQVLSLTHFAKLFISRKNLPDRIQKGDYGDFGDSNK